MATIVTNKFRRPNSIFLQYFLIVLFVFKVYTTGKNAEQVRILNCNGNNNKINKCRVFTLPRKEEEKQMWLDVLPVRRNFSIYSRKYFICERHWPSKYPKVTLPGSSTRSFLPPSVFNVLLPSCLTTPKVPPRKRKDEYRLLNHFKSKDTISYIDTFAPEQELNKKYDNMLIQTTRGMIDLCSYLLQTGFKYVLLREIQSDRIEGEFAVYRQSTGANSYMSSVDVTSAFKRRLTRFAASFLESLDNEVMNPSTAAHGCLNWSHCC